VATNYWLVGWVYWFYILLCLVELVFVGDKKNRNQLWKAFTDCGFL